MKIQKQPPKVFCKKGVLKKFTNFTENACAGVSFVGFQACDFVKKRLRHGCFPLKFTKYLRTPILKNIYKRLLLKFR